MITQDDIENWFSYHAPQGTDAQLYVQLRDSAAQFATDIINLTPAGADQSAAIRKVREAVMTANAAIACRAR